jgi:hypothetical protein
LGQPKEADMAKDERFSLTELDRIRLCVMHTRAYVKDDKKLDRMLDRLQAKVERCIIGRGRKLQEV